MLDSGGYSGTDWSTTEVIDMWLAICNQDTAPHWQVVSGWRKSYELTSEHLSAVKSYRKNLIDAWPPEKNAASAAYVERLDTLIDHLQQTYDSALANHQALSDVASSLSVSRAKLGPIVDEYYANERALQKFNTTEPPLVAGHGKTKAAAPKPPVADGRQEELASQARSIMYGLGRDLTTAQSRLSQPAVYVPEKDRGGQKDQPGESGGSAPSVPAVVPVDPRTLSQSSGSPSLSHLPSTASGGPVAGSSVVPSAPTHQPGLILGGTGQPPVASPPPTTAIPTLPGNSGSGLTPGIITPTMPGGLGGPLGPSPGFGAVRGTNGEAAGRTGGPVRAMPPGGLIGGSPGAGLGQPAAGARPIQRVNPAGGVIGQGPSQTRPGGAGLGNSAAGPQLVSPQGRRNGSNGGSELPEWDPDNPWVTAEGVAPVVVPPSEQRIDPGPAIGLS